MADQDKFPKALVAHIVILSYVGCNGFLDADGIFGQLRNVSIYRDVIILV